MKNVKKFNIPSEANNYIIKDIPFICSIFDEEKEDDQLLWNDNEDKKIVVDENNHATIVDKIEFVDLGLSVKWAKNDLGETLYSWGEDHYKTGTGSFSWDHYKYGRENNLTKYNSTDGKTILDLDDDIVNIKNGGKWRLPTKEEFEELIDTTKITHSWVTTKPYSYMKFTSIVPGYEGNSIIMKAYGYMDKNGGYRDSGLYWSCMVNLTNYNKAHAIIFNYKDCSSTSYDRYLGLAVYPVCPKN